jgi:hypothetical protein
MTRSVRRPKRLFGRRGIAAVEFALCAPMLLLVLGTLEILMLYRTEEKLNSLAGNLAQMVANQEITTVSSGVTSTHSPVPSTTSGTSPPGLSDPCAGAVYGLQPFPANGLSIYVASVTETQAASQGVAAKAALYDEWEVDLNGSCAPTGAQNIGVNGTTGALTVAIGNGGTTALVQALGDNAIIVRATLQYPGLVGLFIPTARALTQTAIARWRYASATNVTNVTATPAPSSTLEFSCTGTGCITNNGV